MVFKIPEVDVFDWHYRVVCKLCRYHKPIDHKPTEHDFKILLCRACHQLYRDEWEYGIYKLVECSKWYSPFKKYKWVNKE